MLAMSVPAFLAIWAVCAFLAGISWANLVSNTGPGDTITFPELLVLSVSFGLPGAGLVAFAWGIIREQQAR